ncbi:hypothetical protein BH18THE1_BH18THE1_04250 [soil metagenome]
MQPEYCRANLVKITNSVVTVDIILQITRILVGAYPVKKAPTN